MNTTDYIIVGQGLAGTSIAQRLNSIKKSFFVVDKIDTHQASRIASGIWNPIVLKRMKKVWNADLMLDEISSFYTEAEEFLQTSFHDQHKVHRLFATTEEVNNWHEMSDGPTFNSLINPTIKRSQNEYVQDKLGLGEVNFSGRINTEIWLNVFRKRLIEQGLLLNKNFDFNQLQHTEHGVIYGNIKAKGIIFCEGMHAAINNPYFKWLPFAVTKGEVIHIKSPALKLDKIINSSVFILPLGNDEYKVGATYAWNTIDCNTTEMAKNELLEKLSKFITAPFDILEQKAGIRPTIKDRRPLLGTHPLHRNIHIFNGMGSRGILMTPWLSKIFIEYLIHQRALPDEANIKRFKKYFEA